METVGPLFQGRRNTGKLGLPFHLESFWGTDNQRDGLRTFHGQVWEAEHQNRQGGCSLLRAGLRDPAGGPGAGRAPSPLRRTRSREQRAGSRVMKSKGRLPLRLSSLCRGQRRGRESPCPALPSPALQEIQRVVLRPRPTETQLWYLVPPSHTGASQREAASFGPWRPRCARLGFLL